MRKNYWMTSTVQVAGIIEFESIIIDFRTEKLQIDLH